MKIAAIITASILLTAIFGLRAANAEIAYTTLDLSATDFPGDAPYQIICDIPGFAYMTLNQNGMLAKVNMDSKAYELLDPGLGANFYSLAYEPISKSIIANELNSGIVWKYDFDDAAWTSLRITPEADDITYGSQMLVAYSNGFVYSALGVREAGGFAGYAKIEPVGMSVTRIPIEGALVPKAMLVDGNILWMADWQGGDVPSKLFKIDLTTDTLIDTFDLPMYAYPHNLAMDDTNLYVPLGFSGDLATTVQILKVNKESAAKQEFLETGAPLSSTGEGAFAVTRGGDWLYWSDNDHHVGSLNLATGAQLWANNRIDVGNNYFSCIDEKSDIWWSAKGSAKIGVAEPEASHLVFNVTGKVKQVDGTVTKTIKVLIEGNYGCDANMRVKPVAGSLVGKLTIDGTTKTTALQTKVKLTQVDDYAFKYTVNFGTWGKAVGKTTFGTVQDCHNDLGLMKQTKKDSMTLTKSTIQYKMISTSDLGKIAYVE